MKRPKGALHALMVLRPLEDERTDAYRAIRRAWRFGSEEFVERMAEHLEEGIGENQTLAGTGRKDGTAGRTSDRRRIARGWMAAAPTGERAKEHPVKVELARKLRRETTMTLQWIAEALCMGSWSYVFNLLRPAPCGRNRSIKD